MRSARPMLRKQITFCLVVALLMVAGLGKVAKNQLDVECGGA